MKMKVAPVGAVDIITHDSFRLTEGVPEPMKKGILSRNNTHSPLNKQTWPNVSVNDSPHITE